MEAFEELEHRAVLVLGRPAPGWGTEVELFFHMPERADDSALARRLNPGMDADVDDDFIFEPNGWDMAVDMGIGLDPETDAEALDELADAMLLWIEGPALEALADAAVERIWSEELEKMIREGLGRLGQRETWRAGVERALAEFDLDPRKAEVTREVVCHLAMELSHESVPVFFCIDCLEEQISYAGSNRRRTLALQAVSVVQRAIDPNDPSIQTRATVRSRLGRLGGLGRESVPNLAAELRLIAAETVPASPESDDVWRAVRDAKRAEVAHLN